ERLVQSSLPQKHVPEVPARMRISRRQLDGPTQRLLGVTCVSGCIKPASQLHPIAVVMRRKSYCQLIFADRVRQVFSAEILFLQRSEPPVRKRIGGGPSCSQTCHFYAAFLGHGRTTGYELAN